MFDSASSKRLLLIVNCAWCFILLVLLVGASDPSAKSTFLKIISLSAVVLYFQFRFYRSQVRKEQLVIAEETVKVKRQAAIEASSGHKTVLCTVLGGSGSLFKKESNIILSCAGGFISLTDRDTGELINVRVTEIFGLDISGPGTQRSNAGVVGGGFGIEGAIKGMLVASVLNKLTEKSTTNTFIRISTQGSETYLHTSSVGPSELRIILSPAYVQIEKLARGVSQIPDTGISAEIGKLHALLKDGALTNEEFAAAKSGLLNSSVRKSDA